MGKAIQLLFNLHPGERRKAFLFVILALLWGIGSYGTFALSEGMFLEHVGAHILPYAYFAIALNLCFFSFTLIFSLNRFSIRYLLFALITLWVISNLIFLFLLFTEIPQSTSYWFIYKVAGWVMPVSIYIVYWAFVDQYFDLQDGKRLFCLFNSVLFLGDAIGGGIVSFLLEPLEMTGLIVLFSTTMALSLPCIFLITSSVKPLLEEHTESIDTTSSLSFKSIIKYVLKSKYTLFLLLFYFSMQLLVVTTEYNYMEAFEQVFSGKSEKKLTEFIGRCGMWISLGNMLFGLLIYSRLVKKMRVNNIILVAPSAFIALFSIWFCNNALSLAVFAMVTREMMAYSFDDNNLNLLISGVPTKIKNQIRIFVESFIEPAAMFSTAFLLLLLQNKIALLGFSLSFIALIVAIFLRFYYPRAIFRNLVASTIRFEKKAADWIAQLSHKEKKRAEFLLLSNLKNQTREKEQLLAYEYLLKMGNPRVLPRILNHIGNLSVPGKLKAIELLSESSWAKHSLVLKRIKRWRALFPHSAIKSAIHFYLARHGLLAPHQIVHDIHSEHLGLRGAAILALRMDPQHHSMASKRLYLLLESKDEKEICVGLKILGFERDPTNIAHIFPNLKHPSVTVNTAAARALSQVAHPTHHEYAISIISRLSITRDPQLRLFYLEALEKMKHSESIRELLLTTVHFRPSERKQVERIVLAIGNLAISALLEIMKEEKAHVRCRLLAGKILGKLDLFTLRKELYPILHVEIERAYFYFYHAQTIQKQIPEQNLTILTNALMTRYHSIIDFIIQLLGSGESIEECEILSFTLRSSNRKIRAQAVESLEKTCDPQLFALLEPLIDERHPEKKLHHYLKKGRIPLNLTQLLDTMTHSPSLADQIVSIGLKARLKTADWRTTLRQKLEGGEEVFHHFAHALLDSV